jgi:pyruvate/2-oxoglutarate dehydrogenase complex dihydrolipoamide acyltransferase (E2) component
MKVNVLFNTGKRSQLKIKLAQHLQKAGKLTIEGDGYLTRHMEAGVATPEASAPQASKAAQTLADENGIDLSTIVGTGLHGNITKADVERAISA